MEATQTKKPRHVVKKPLFLPHNTLGFFTPKLTISPGGHQQDILIQFQLCSESDRP